MIEGDWGSHTEIGAGVSGRELYYYVPEGGVKGYVCRIFNECDWWVMTGTMKEGLPMRSQNIVGKHVTLEGAKAALLVMLAL